MTSGGLGKDVRASPDVPSYGRDSANRRGISEESWEGARTLLSAALGAENRTRRTLLEDTAARPFLAQALRDYGMALEVAGRAKEAADILRKVGQIWKQLRREGIDVGRDRVARIMRELGIAGVVRGRARRTTVPDPSAVRAPDLVNREFVASCPGPRPGRPRLGPYRRGLAASR